MDDMKQVEIFTDGACSGNPGPGGYGVILRYGNREKELSGGERETTNNRMELMAAITGLEALKLGWAAKWRANGWMRNKKDAALNPDLWERLLAQTERHEVELVWVKGHAGHPENERCDRLAVAETEKYKTK